MCLKRKPSFLSSGPSDRLTVGHYFFIHTESFHFWNNILNGLSQQRSIFSPVIVLALEDRNKESGSIVGCPEWLTFTV